MRWSQTLIPTMKEVPSDAEIPSHQLMLRAGLIRQLMAGAYTYLPLGYRAIRKASEIIRQEMDAAGAVELYMPALQPIELFERTGRREAFGNVLINFPIRRRDQKLQMALGPTHEEVVTDLMSKLIGSYRQLPITVYQIQTKFRNEERPRFGVLRTSEFLMKDAYSFGTSIEQLDESYQQMYDAYCRIYSRCGLEYIPVEAESGPIGGDASHEFMIPAQNGEDGIVRCEECGYAANLERAETGRQQPELAGKDSTTEAQTVATPGMGSIEAVAAFLKIETQRMIKTLIYLADGKPVGVLLRGDHEANEGKIRRALGVTSLEMADEATIQEVTGAPVGFAGPTSLKCRYVVDHDVAAIVDGVTGANAVDQHLMGVNPGRDFAVEQTFDLRNAEEGDPCPRCSGTMNFVHGIEVGHVFKLGTKYSSALDAVYLDEKEQRHPLIMGCYGIGVNRIIAGLAETCHDENGLIWPMTVAPYEIELIPLNVNDAETMVEANRIYAELGAANIEVLMDDRDARPGFKFKDADLVGIPLRVVIGGKGLKDGIAEVKWRKGGETERVALTEVSQHVIALVQAEKNRLAGK